MKASKFVLGVRFSVPYERAEAAVPMRHGLPGCGGSGLPNHLLSPGYVRPRTTRPVVAKQKGVIVFVFLHLEP